MPHGSHNNVMGYYQTMIINNATHSNNSISPHLAPGLPTQPPPQYFQHTPIVNTLHDVSLNNNNNTHLFMQQQHQQQQQHLQTQQTTQQQPSQNTQETLFYNNDNNQQNKEQNEQKNNDNNNNNENTQFMTMSEGLAPAIVTSATSNLNMNIPQSSMIPHTQTTNITNNMMQQPLMAINMGIPMDNTHIVNTYSNNMNNNNNNNNHFSIRDVNLDISYRSHKAIFPPVSETLNEYIQKQNLQKKQLLQTQNYYPQNIILNSDNNSMPTNVMSALSPRVSSLLLFFLLA